MQLDVLLVCMKVPVRQGPLQSGTYNVVGCIE